MTETSLACDKREHENCDGTVSVFDTEDGPNRYICACGCHNTSVNERPCPTCRGTGALHDTLSYGRWSTEPGKLPNPHETYRTTLT